MGHSTHSGREVREGGEIFIRLGEGEPEMGTFSDMIRIFIFCIKATERK